MKDISEIDTNFKIETSVQKENLKFHNIRTAPFKIYGVFWENGRFCRMPQSVADSVSPGVAYLNTNTAGGRVRFKTDSPYIAVHAEMDNVGKMSHFALTGSSGFDLYTVRDCKEQYFESFVPPFNITDGYESVIDFPDRQMREITVHFPTYSGVTALFIGTDESSTLAPPSPYKIEKPIVYYGSSITQGGCTSRPGNTYESFISRELDVNYINLGFSGSALGEEEISDYIKGLDMSAFVFDYDHNAPDEKHLAATHEKMFKKIRAAQPDLPIIILPRPKFYLTKEEERRFDIIKSTYDNAIKNNDKNVYMLSGKELMSLSGSSGSVDGCHPNDFGFASMANALVPLLKKIL